MRKLLLIGLLFLAGNASAAKIAVTVGDGSLQPGTTAGFNVSSGTVGNFRTANAISTGTWNINGSTWTGRVVDQSSRTVTGTLTLNAELRAGLTSSTSGQYLVSQGSTLAPKFQWAGRVLQVVNGSIVAAATSTVVSATFVRSGVAVSITPIQNGSTIVVIANLGAFRNSTTASTAYASIFRGATNLASGPTNPMAITQVSGTVTAINPCSIIKMDSPGTTSTTTYEVYFKTDAAGTAVISGSGIDAQMIAIEIGQ